MNYEHALSILGLKPNFTEEDLKKAFRQKSNEYHPDRWIDTDFYEESIRKQQEINAARELLRNYLRNNIKSTEQNQFDISRYTKEKLERLKSIVNSDNSLNDIEELQEVLKKINDEIYSFETDAITFFIPTKAHIDRLYASCIISIRMILENFVASFYQKYYIDETEIKETITYDCNLGDFYNQLLRIKNKYSKVVKVSKQLDEEIEQYKGYAGYKELKTLIEVCKKNALIDIKQNNFQNIEEEIQKMHQVIKEEVFEEYYAFKKKISDLESIVNNIPDESIKKEYFDICNHFEKGTSFYDTEQAIQKLEEHISEYQEIELKKQKQKEIDDEINKIYQSIISRYSESLKQYNIVTDSEKIKNLNELLMEILKIFTKGCEEFKDLEFFKAFDNITFQNENSDREIVENAIQELKSKKSNIYIKTTDNYMFDDSSFFCFDEQNMIMYKVGYDTSSKKITQEEFETEYIPLEQILGSSIFVGKYMKMISSPVKVLYECDRVVLYYYNQKFSVSSRTKFYNSYFYQVSNQTTDDSFNQFKNKQYVCEMIEKQVKEKIEEYKKQQAQKSDSYSPNPNIYGNPAFNTDDSYYNNGTGTRRRR